MEKHFAAATIGICFIAYFVIRGLNCPCPNTYHSTSSIIKCSRYEIHGWQINHLFFYAVIGFMFPDQFWFWQALGVLWEIIELVPYVLPQTLAWTGGCVHYDLLDKPYQVHWLDDAVGLQSPREHFWHVKLTDIVLNLVGFALGYFMLFCVRAYLSTA